MILLLGAEFAKAYRLPEIRLRSKYCYGIRYLSNPVDIVNSTCIVRNDFIFLLYNIQLTLH